ncbi:phenylacetate--CoA ligase family protein [Streptomyces sp. DG2A-72]|uniref:phenylacetate--CoA ligase family protein n=1 Tax=Streptomyces sp. DG2A-72 TaxID=3051386 RepID=UPI00265C12B7|nr:phenylacetate--CoA ligase family protein [Streptomyces sp. DG2A-72]MDO0930791.1 phenylacetate--CoA ligase family protein [Streptomyces sp. DG2A-72]
MPAKPLPVLVDYARRNSPFYADLYRDLPEVITDLTQLPVVDQEAFWDANTFPGNRLLTRPLTNGIVYKSGGTTGAPKFSPWDEEENTDAVVAFGTGLVRAGVRPGHRVANLFFAGELYSGFAFMNDVLTHAPIENLRLPIAGAAPVEFVASVFKEFGVNVTCGMASTLVRLADLLIERGEVADSVERLLFAGEPLFDDVRSVLAQAFPKATVGSLGYAAVDGGPLGAPVPGDDVRVHESLAPYSLIELLDEATGEPITRAGMPGRVIATNTSRTLMPVIRYPVGDRAEWTDVERKQFRLLGRSEDAVKVGPDVLRPGEVRNVIARADRDGVVTGMQLVARRWEGRDGLVLRLAAQEQAPDGLDQAVIDAVYAASPPYPRAVRRGTIHPITVEWVRPAELTTNPRTGKLIEVVDERPSP